MTEDQDKAARLECAALTFIGTASGALPVPLVPVPRRHGRSNRAPAELP